MLNQLIIERAKLLAGSFQLRHIYHMPNTPDILLLVENKKNIESYQRYQSKGRKIGKKSDLSVSWVHLGQTTYVYAGIYKNKQDRKLITLKNWEGTDYDSVKVPNEFDSLIGKLVITLEKSLGQSWVRLKPQPVLTEDVKSSVVSYPGHDEVLLSFQELKAAVKSAAYREAWSHVWSVYRWTNIKDGKSYIGSACGSAGLLQRMESYSTWMHGNKILSKVDPEDMQMSIIYAIDKGYISEKEILEKEYKEIKKVMSHIHGYNHGGLDSNRKRIDKLLKV
jgi:hypothetical protein